MKLKTHHNIYSDVLDCKPIRWFKSVVRFRAI